MHEHLGQPRQPAPGHFAAGRLVNRHLAPAGNGQATGLQGLGQRLAAAGIAGIIQTGWLGAVTTNIGAGMELQVIAAAVIGGANLAGGVGTAFGALVGAALIEVIRNSLGLLGINAFWQGAFIGGAIILAVSALVDRGRISSSTKLPGGKSARPNRVIRPRGVLRIDCPERDWPMTVPLTTVP